MQKEGERGERKEGRKWEEFQIIMKMAKVNNGHIWGHACTVQCTCSFLTGEMLTKYISMTNTTSHITENIINFDSEGNVVGNYDALNFQHNTSSDCTEPCYNNKSGRMEK